MITVKNLLIKNKFNDEIGIDLYQSDTSTPNMPLIIFAHGFKGFKDWGGFPYMMNKFAENGFASVSFNFSHNGVDKNNLNEFVRLDLFAKNTYSLEIEDLKCVIDYLYNNSDKFSINKNKIVLIGHSRGGGISMIIAAEDTRIKYLVTLSAVSKFDRYSKDHKAKWRKEGYFEVLNTRTNQMMRIDDTLLDDLEKNKDRFNIKNVVRKIEIPFLIIHGKEDLSVNFSEAEDIYKNSNKMYSELFPVEKTGHTFGIVHPFQGTTKAFDMVINKILSFINNAMNA